MRLPERQSADLDAAFGTTQTGVRRQVGGNDQRQDEPAVFSSVSQSAGMQDLGTSLPSEDRCSQIEARSRPAAAASHAAGTAGLWKIHKEKLQEVQPRWILPDADFGQGRRHTLDGKLLMRLAGTGGGWADSPPYLTQTHRSPVTWDVPESGVGSSAS